jgi:hypothetical protein
VAAAASRFWGIGTGPLLVRDDPRPAASGAGGRVKNEAGA